MKTVDEFNFLGKKALIRVDFNVPLNERFEITDDTLSLIHIYLVDVFLHLIGCHTYTVVRNGDGFSLFVK